MNKVLMFTSFVVLLAAFPTVAAPYDLKLTATPNVVSRKGCLVTARALHGTLPSVGSTLSLYYVPPSHTTPPPFASLVTNNGGKAQILVPWGKTIEATMQGHNLVVSNSFTCPAKDPTE